MLDSYEVTFYYMYCDNEDCVEYYEPNNMDTEDELFYCIKESDWTNPSGDEEEGEWFCPECSSKLEEEKE